MVRNIAEQSGVRARPNLCEPEFAVLLGRLYPAAQLFGHGLHAVADTQHGHPESKYRIRRARTVTYSHGFRPTGQDDSPRRKRPDIVVVDVKRVYFAVDTRLAHAARDQLGRLTTKVQNEDAIAMDVQ
jgi:hypothetical protein